MQLNESTTVKTIMDGTQLRSAGDELTVVVGRSTDTVADASDLFLKWDLHHLPIVDGPDDAIVGIVSARDVMKHYATSDESDPKSVTLDRVMTGTPVVILPNSTIKEAVGMFARAKFQALPVDDLSRRVIGIVTTRDIVQYLHAHYLASQFPPPRKEEVADAFDVPIDVDDGAG